MKNNRISKSIVCITLFCCFCFSISSKINKVNAISNGSAEPIVQYSFDLDEYYLDTQGLSGNELLEELASLMSETHKTYVSYGEIKGANALSDEDPNNENNMILFYSGASISNAWDYKVWNREHVWCKSLSGGLYTEVDDDDRNAGSDLHQLKPAATSVNTSRNNKPYAELNKTGTEITYSGNGIGCYSKDSLFEPRDDIKGDIARTLMYMYTHYSNEVSNSTEGYNGYMKIENIMYTPLQSAEASWQQLLRWNALDPVDEFEENRNDYVSSVQGNRNPFIDHPEFANMIWDEKYSGEGALLDNSFTSPSDSLCLATYKKEISINDVFVLNTLTIPEKTVAFTSSNKNVATIDENGKVTPKSLGLVTLTAQTENNTKSCLINIVEKNSQGNIYKDQIYTYEIATYDAGKQYENKEKHVLDDNMTIYVNNGFFSTDIRMYSSSTHNTTVYTDALPTCIKTLNLTLGYSKDTLIVYGSSDGVNYYTVSEVVVTTSSMTKYTVDFSAKSYNYFKLDVKGANQIRVSEFSIQYQQDVIQEEIKYIATDSINPTLFNEAEGKLISYNGYSYSYSNITNDEGTLKIPSHDFYLCNNDSYGFIKKISLESDTPVDISFGYDKSLIDGKTLENVNGDIEVDGNYGYFKIYLSDGDKNKINITKLVVYYEPLSSIKLQKSLDNTKLRIVVEVNNRYYTNVVIVVNKKYYYIDVVKQEIITNDTMMSSSFESGYFVTLEINDLAVQEYNISAYVQVNDFDAIYAQERTFTISSINPINAK